MKSTEIQAVDDLQYDVQTNIGEYMRFLLEVASLIGLQRTLEMSRSEWLDMRADLPKWLWMGAEDRWFDRRMHVLRKFDVEPQLQFFGEDGAVLTVPDVFSLIQSAMAWARL